MRPDSELWDRYIGANSMWEDLPDRAPSHDSACWKQRGPEVEGARSEVEVTEVDDEVRDIV